MAINQCCKSTIPVISVRFSMNTFLSDLLKSTLYIIEPIKIPIDVISNIKEETACVKIIVGIKISVIERHFMLFFPLITFENANNIKKYKIIPKLVVCGADPQYI